MKATHIVHFFPSNTARHGLENNYCATGYFASEFTVRMGEATFWQHNGADGGAVKQVSVPVANVVGMEPLS